MVILCATACGDGSVFNGIISMRLIGPIPLLTLMLLFSGTNIVLTSCTSSTPSPVIMAEKSPEETMPQSFVPREVLVKFKPSVSKERIDAILKETGTEQIIEIKGTRIHHVRIVGKGSVESVVNQLSALQEVEYAEPNFGFR